MCSSDLAMNEPENMIALSLAKVMQNLSGASEEFAKLPGGNWQILGLLQAAHELRDDLLAYALDENLREKAEEEIGLDRKFIEPLGLLDPYLSSTGYRILPVVALVQPGFTLRPGGLPTCAVVSVCPNPSRIVIPQAP